MESASVQLRPMGVGDVLDNALQIYRKNFSLMIRVAAVVGIPLYLVRMVITELGNPANSSSRILLPDAPVYILAIFTGILLIIQVCALAIAVSERYLGRTITVRACYFRTFKHGLALIPLMILSIIASLASSFASAVQAAGVRIGFSLAILPIVSLCIPIFLVFVDNFVLFAVQPTILENLNPLAGLRRTLRLIITSFWRLIFLNFGLSIFSWLIIAIASLLGFFLAAAIGFNFLGSFGYLIINGTVISLVGFLVAPIRYTVLTLFYYELRIRKEGFDLELRAKQMMEATA